MSKTLLITLATSLLMVSAFTRAQSAPATSTAMPAASVTTAMPAAPAATHKPPMVTQAQFTTGVSNREPADAVSSLDNSHDQVFFFTALKDAAGQTITHRWEFNGKTVAEVNLQPKANHWRTWSSKILMPDQIGTWTVQVLDDSGKVLMSKSFDYTRAPVSGSEAAHKQPVMQNAPTPAAPAETKTTPPSL